MEKPETLSKTFSTTFSKTFSSDECHVLDEEKICPSVTLLLGSVCRRQKMNSWMDGWTDGWMDGLMDDRTNDKASSYY